MENNNSYVEDFPYSFMSNLIHSELYRKQGGRRWQPEDRRVQIDLKTMKINISNKIALLK